VRKFGEVIINGEDVAELPILKSEGSGIDHIVNDGSKATNHLDLRGGPENVFLEVLGVSIINLLPLQMSRLDMQSLSSFGKMNQIG